MAMQARFPTSCMHDAAWRWCWGCCNHCTGEMLWTTMIYTFHAPETTIRPPDGFAISMTLSTCHRPSPCAIQSKKSCSDVGVATASLPGRPTTATWTANITAVKTCTDHPGWNRVALNHGLWIVWPWLQLDRCTICPICTTCDCIDRFRLHGHRLRYQAKVR